MLRKMVARFTRLHYLDLSQSVSRSFYSTVTDSDLCHRYFLHLGSLNLQNCKVKKYIVDTRVNRRDQLNSLSNMKNQIQEHVIGIPISSAAYPTERTLGNLLPDHILYIQCYIPPSNASSKLNQISSFLERLEKVCLDG